MTRFIRLSIVFAILMGLGLVAGCGDDNPVKPKPPTPDIYSLGLTRTGWTLASAPNPLVGDETWQRGTIRWHNPPAISREDVYTDETAAGTGALYPLRLIFRPHGFRNAGPAENPCFSQVETRSWGGIMRAWSGGLPPGYLAGDSIFLEMRLKPSGGIMHIEFGRINENIDGDDIADTEDLHPPNATIDDGEDTGLDTLMDQDELDRCLQAYDATYNPDPAGDNWWYEGYGKGAGVDNSRPPIPASLWNSAGYRDLVNDLSHWLHYEWINGTEGNADDPAALGAPDREDLELNGLNVVDAYLSYEIPLVMTDTTDPFVVPGSGYNGWYTFRVPVWHETISDTVRSHPALEINWEFFSHVRVWFEQPEYGMDSLLYMDSLWIADWRLVAYP